MRTFLKSTYPCLVKAQNDEFELEKNDTIEIVDEKIIYIYPQNKSIPFYINTQNLCDCEKYSVFVHDNEQFVFLESEPNFSLEIKEKLNFPGKICEISLKNRILSFETTNKKISTSVSKNCTNFEVQKIKNFACALFENDLYAFSMKEEKLYHFSGEIEISGNQISVTRKFFDSVEREKKSTFRLDDGIELENEEFLSVDGEFAEDLLPYKVLESVKAKDFQFVINSFCDKLKENIDAAQIKTFFGNLKEFLPLSTNEFILLSDGEKKFATFSTKNHKIEDVSVDKI